MWVGLLAGGRGGEEAWGQPSGTCGSTMAGEVGHVRKPFMGLGEKGTWARAT